MCDERRRLVEEITQRRRRRVHETLYRHERDWRLRPGDGGDPSEISPLALDREIQVELTARRNVVRDGFADLDTYEAALETERRRIKYFPVLFVSAPHIEDAVSGTFPGMPTPLLFATTLMDRSLRIDEFPSLRVPDVVAVMNPALYSQEFRDELLAMLLTHRPRLVGISNLSESHYFAMEIARLVKETAPETIVLLGGQHEDATNPLAYRRTAERRHTLPPAQRAAFAFTDAQLGRAADIQTLGRARDRALVDFVAAGDGPYLLMAFVRLLADHPDADVETVKELVLRTANEFAGLPGSGDLFFFDDVRKELRHVSSSGAPIDGSSLPFISVGHLTHENRFPIFDQKMTAQVMACVGCKYACAFCHESADHVLYGLPKLLQRSPEHVMKELELRREQGFEAIFFDDSTFTQNPRWLGRFLELMRTRWGPSDRLEWGCQTTINDVGPAILADMADLGCSYVYFGVESARPGTEMVQKARQLRVITGESDWAARFRRVATWCRDAGIRVGTSLQFGLGESEEDRVATLELIAELYESGCIARGCVALNVNAPYPGTGQWCQLLRSDDPELPDYRQRLVRHPAFETAHQFTRLPATEIEAIYDQVSRKLGDAVLSVDFGAHDRWRRRTAPVG